MRKIFTFITALTLSVGLFAEEVDLKPFIKYENQEGTFDYPYYPSWSDNSGRLRIFRDNGLQDLNLKAGVSKIVFYKTAGTTGQIYIGNPNWSQLTTVADWDGGLTTLEYVLDEYAIKCINGDIVDGWSETAFGLMGDGLEVTKIAIETGTDPLPFDPQFVDAQSGLTFRVTDFGEVNNVKVVFNNNESHTYSGDLVIPSTVNYQDVTFTVTQIGRRAFYGCSGLTSVTIPNSVTTIGDDAFFLVNNIVYNGTATGSPWGAKCVNGYVDGYLVYSDASKTTLCGCYSAATGEFIIPNSVKTIGDYAFYGCRRLTSVTIPNSVTTIGRYAFSDCYSLPVIDNLRYADTYLVEAIDKTLSTYTIKDGTKWIGDGAFANCGGLTSITIPNSVTTIGDNAFFYCYSLTSIDILNSVIEIGNGAFFDCISLTSVSIPNSVTTIGEQAFYRCKGLTSVIIGNSVTTIGEEAFLGCSGLTSVTIGNSVITIGEYAFAGCFGLTSITIPNSVTTIGDLAFTSCGFTSIAIPSSVTTIGNQAFEGSKLKDVEVAWTSSDQLPIMGNYVFEHIVDGVGLYAATLHVPAGTKSIYEAADQWKDFGTIIEKEPQVDDMFEVNGLWYQILTLGVTNTVKVISNHSDYDSIQTVNIPNSISLGETRFDIIEIGDSAFKNCLGLTSVTIPNSVTTIENEAFNGCKNIRKITCFAKNPPICGTSVFSGLSQYTKAYVLATSLEDYQFADVWRDLNLYPIESEVIPLSGDQPIVTPSSQDVTITWPITDGTDTYTLTITKNGEVVCVLTFNANGQLTNIAFAAPGHNGAHQAPAATLTAQGYQFTVTGLNPGTAYDYSVTATDAGGQTLAEHKGNFSTTGGGTPTSVDEVHGSQCTTRKFFHNGNLIIERNGIKYTPAGQKVR